MVGSPIAELSGPQDPSQLEATINGLIVQLNSVLTGSSPSSTPSAQSTAASIAGFGTVTINTTTRTAGTTGRYAIAAPVAGRNVVIKNLSTVKAVITGLFERGKTKISLTSTAALASVNLPGVMLRGISTSAWAVVAQTGKILTT